MTPSHKRPNWSKVVDDHGGGNFIIKPLNHFVTTANTIHYSHVATKPVLCIGVIRRLHKLSLIRLLIGSALLELWVNRFAPFLLEKEDSTRAWYVMLDYTGLFLFAFSSVLSWFYSAALA